MASRPDTTPEMIDRNFPADAEGVRYACLTVYRSDDEPEGYRWELEAVFTDDDRETPKLPRSGGFGTPWSAAAAARVWAAGHGITVL